MSRSLWSEAWISWPAFLLALLLLGLLYFLLKYLSQRLNSGLYLQEADSAVKSFVRVLALVLDPLLLLVVAGLLVSLKPAVHGLVLLLVALFAFRPIRDYVAGRVLRFDEGVQVGRHLVFGVHSGVINAFGLTGLYLQREAGRTRLSYHELLRQGYSVAADPRKSAWYHLLVRESPMAAESVKRAAREAGTEEVSTRERQVQLSLRQSQDMARRLRFSLLENPYVRQGFRIAPLPDQSEGPIVELDVGVHRAEHIQHLIWQLEEDGFSASLIQR